MGEDDFELFLRLSTGSRLCLRRGGFTSESTILAVKRAIAGILPDAPVGQQRVIYKGRILDDDGAALSQYGIVHQSTLFLVVSRGAAESSPPRAVQSPSAAADSSAPAPSSSSPPIVQAQASSAQSDRLRHLMEQSGTGAGSAMMRQSTTTTASSSSSSLQSSMQGNAVQGQGDLLGSIMSGGGLGGAGVSGEEPWMRRLMQNMDPNLLARMLQSQLDSNPVLQRLMDENPHLRHMMTDPGALQQAAQLMRDPEAMQQAMRQQDLALSQIENMPGGFASLSNMYRNMQVPLEESLLSSRQTRSAGAGGPSAPSPPSSSATLPGTAMPNPWGSPSSSASSSSSANRSAQGSGNSSLPGLSNNLLPQSVLQSLMSAPDAARGQSSASNPWGNLGGAGSDRSGLPAVPGLPPRLPPGGLRSVMELARQHPEMFRAAVQADPRSRSLLGDDPAAYEAMMRLMRDPQFLQMMERLEDQMGGGIPGLGSPFGGLSMPRPGGGGVSGLDFSSLLQNSMMSGGAAGPSGLSGGLGLPFQPQAPLPSQSSATAPPRERFRRQLAQLTDMGFDQEDSCLAALEAEHGNVNRAVERLLSGPPPSPPSSQAPTPLPHPEPAPTSSDSTDAETAAPPKNASEKKND